jgi:hypothetical protein
MYEPAEQNEQLEPLIGEWTMEMVLSEQENEKAPEALPDVKAELSFEWMGKKAWVLQRWSVPIPEAPDGLSLMGWDESRGTFLQHYFDDRGVARVYEMSLGDGVWVLERTKPDFSPFDFSQRFTGTFSDDGRRIDGTFEISHDHKTWEKDFDVRYERVS